MPSGGARVRSGPPPDPAANRRNRPSDRAGFVHLPAAGREGDPPEWPLPGRASKFELERWAIEWRKPQAIMWERLGLEIHVAMYVRTLGASAKSHSASAVNNLLRMMDSLGLSAAGQASLRWIIDDEPAQPAPRRAATSTAKDRLNVITGGKSARSA